MNCYSQLLHVRQEQILKVFTIPRHRGVCLFPDSPDISLNPVVAPPVNSSCVAISSFLSEILPGWNRACSKCSLRRRIISKFLETKCLHNEANQRQRYIICFLLTWHRRREAYDNIVLLLCSMRGERVPISPLALVEVKLYSRYTFNKRHHLILNTEGKPGLNWIGGVAQHPAQIQHVDTCCLPQYQV